MGVMWSAEQILALAPDAASAKNGQGLARTNKWLTLGQSENALWGECQGSGKNPYQTSMDLSEPAFKCSCPSRKFPCKHGLGLFLLFAAQPGSFSSGNPPPFCAEWLEKRTAKKTLKETKPKLTEEEKRTREQAKAKRGEERGKKVAEGLRELELWLRDLARQGLAVAQSKPASYWDNIAKRMIDAQAPGVARLLRELADSRRHDDMLETAGRLFLLLEAYKNLENLPAPAQADVKTAVGFTIKEDELGDENKLTDTWQVVGQKIYEEDRLRVLRTWLRGKETGRNALVLSFAAPQQALKMEFRVGTETHAELAFYPSNYPLRAIVRQKREETEFARPEGYADFAAFQEAYAEALSRHPWLETFPAVFPAVLPVAVGEQAFLQDRNGQLLPLTYDKTAAAKYFAMSGGHEIACMGEWRGTALFPLAAWAEGHTETYLHLANWAQAR
jgi:hypothetical protein